MGSGEVKNNEILNFIIERSLFTSKQFDIISKRRRGEHTVEHRSRGAYYRLLKQSRDKLSGLIYSFLLLQLAGLLDDQTRNVVDRLVRQVGVTQSSDIDEQVARDVIHVMDELVRRISKI
ncbi:MAG: hypothetical protein HMLIMOIP_001023 [Candidatus Nitrosomirales archaeon]|jgi:hypothetical protein